ncbi:MAG: SDR family NAD(P)-dependent oxidoreductase [Candidatus Freyarchaeota archaeon]|nr:SDR family NAD(P)-dependent oxidoreductase [Candidatus Jordarchaeia archaeon]
MKGKLVLVTGGAGFIGSHLVDWLIRDNEVVVLDNFSSGKISNVKHHLGRNGFTLIKGDILDKKIVREAVKDVDVVIHQAAVVGVKKYVERPLDVMTTNIFGTHNLVEECLREGVERFVFASTSEVYGKSERIPLRENEDRVLGATSIARWCYSTSKAVDEHFLFAYYEAYGFPMVILRYFNVYGPRQETSDYSGVIPIFIRRVLGGEPPLIHGDGEQTRAFTYISDAVEATVLAASKKDAVGEVFNVGSKEEVTINQLARMIIELSGNEFIEPKHIPYEEFYGESYEDIRRRIPDVKKAERVLGFKAKTPLREGLKKTIEWYREYFSQNLTTVR